MKTTPRTRIELVYWTNQEKYSLFLGKREGVEGLVIAWFNNDGKCEWRNYDYITEFSEYLTWQQMSAATQEMLDSSVGIDRTDRLVDERGRLLPRKVPDHLRGLSDSDTNYLYQGDRS